MFATMVWGEKKQPGFEEELTLWMRQFFPFSVRYPNKYVLIPQAVMLAPSWCASVREAARSWQILKLGRTYRVTQHSWFGCLFRIWCRFNKLSGKKWKPQAVARKVVRREGSQCACAAVELGVCSLCTPERSTAGLHWHEAWAKTQFLCMIPSWRHTALFLPPFFSVLSELVSSCSLRCRP